MTLAELILYYRRRVRDVDPFAYEQTNQEVAVQLEDSRRQLQAKRVSGMDAFGITATSTPTLTGAEPSDELGFLLGTYAAWQYLGDEFTRKLHFGAFGTIWRSGLEEESSIEAAKAYQRLVDKLEYEWHNWVLTINRDRFSTRIQ